MQTAVIDPMVIGSAGQLADLYTISDGDVVPGTNEEAAANIPFGCLAFRSSAEGIKLPATLANVKVGAGVLVKEEIFDVTTQLADVTVNTNLQSAIKPGVTGNTVRRGRVLVIPEANGTEASAVHVRIVASGGNTQLGSFTPTAEVGKTVSLGPSAKWIGAPAVGVPCIVEIDALNFDLATAD